MMISSQDSLVASLNQIYNIHVGTRTYLFNGGLKIDSISDTSNGATAWPLHYILLIVRSYFTIPQNIPICNHQRYYEILNSSYLRNVGSSFNYYYS